MKLTVPLCLVIGAITGWGVTRAVTIYNNSQNPRPSVMTSYGEVRRGIFGLSNKQAETVMIGDSITEGFMIDEHCPGIVNRGISSQTSGEMLKNLDLIYKTNPKTAVVMIGVGDYINGTQESTASNIGQILKNLTGRGIKVVWVKTLPLAGYDRHSYNPKIVKMNNEVEVPEGVVVLDLWPQLAPKGNLLNKFTFDGVHLNGPAYQIWLESLKPLIEC